MKNYLLMALMFLPSLLIAQEVRREATPEEIKQFGGIDQAYKWRDQIEQQAAIIQIATDQGSLNQTQMKEHVQFLINQNQSSEQIKKSIDQLSEDYLSARLMKKLHAPLSETRVKDFEKKFEELEQKELSGKLSQAELKNARMKLDKEIAYSHLSANDELARDNFKTNLLSVAGEMASAKKTLQAKVKVKSLVKVFVANDFSLATACLPTPTQVDQLNSQVKAVIKPTKHKVWFVWPADKFEISASYDGEQGIEPRREPGP